MLWLRTEAGITRASIAIVQHCVLYLAVGDVLGLDWQVCMIKSEVFGGSPAMRRPASVFTQRVTEDVRLMVSCVFSYTASVVMIRKTQSAHSHLQTLPISLRCTWKRFNML